MKCHECGAEFEKLITDLPFKVKQDSIVIIKKLPIYQCTNCREYLIEDETMEMVDKHLNKIDKSVELEILSFAN
ncbi:MAG: YgiT-type zinc finger protein [Ignavibacteria bacterium]|nr:YgiT-type zinc finger protein [Ignavibacteria bacterium]